ncbi:UDP-3-O-acylglucosamine N-acyltransferase [Thalassotalea loyana]|uniref:UDP-3-O-acylglucosamine N-acyltransferase n=1 Tax=Thalassotalea loyana TaxID=280483 RepID=A0ABQ6HG53_9GAMM|nr:UDP-3-O-(3-hydroxymyristoyl)glucosamine N-acyltransferase [Thalassotalea loyana]GLX87063.1 UDP-3-O-acylglucosamine N-acyltransferase [Thalassotalea loyana]
MNDIESFTLAQLAEKIGATVHGNDSCSVSSLATLANAREGQITFLSNAKYKGQLAQTKASAVILSPDAVADCPTNALVLDNPYVGFARVAQMLDTTPLPATNVHKSAIISESAILGEGVAIGANAVIEDDVVLGKNVVIGAGCFVGKASQIGDNTKLWANVSIYHSVKMGKDCLVQSNTVIGSDGFGYANENGNWVKIPQLGGVIIGDRVEIGASTTIDRGALDDTIIEDGVILDNQIQIAHNVVVGQNTCMAGSSVIAGSTTIGKNCVFGGMAGINGHIEIADGTMLTGMAMVTKSITKAGVYSSGIPAQTNKEWHKTNARINRLEALQKQVKSLTKQIESLTQEDKE